jgi:hypothetical protein
VPALQRLDLRLNPTEVTSDSFAELGIEHCSNLSLLLVEINCYREAPGRVEALESSIEKAIDMYPNCKIHVSRVCEFDMFKDDKEREEAVAKKQRKEECSKELAKNREEQSRVAE